MYKLLVLDFDDTLLNDHLKIDQKTIEALKEAEKKGVIILFCSGRSEESMIPYIQELQLGNQKDYYIAYNGAQISSIDGETIMKRHIEQPALKRLVEIGREFDVVTQLYYENKVIVEKDSPTITVYQQRTKVDVEINEKIDELKYSVKVLYNSEDIPKLNEIKTRIETELDEEVNVFFSKPIYLEILRKGVDKGQAVRYMAEQWGIEREEIIAMGDGFNDIPMLEYAGLGIAVQNARDGVKEAADYVTSNDNNHNPVAEVVERFILQK